MPTEFHDFSNILNEEHDVISDRRRHLLGERLTDPSLDYFIGQLDIRDNAKQDLREALRRLYFPPTPAEQPVLLSEFEDRLTNVIASVNDQEKESIKRLFIYTKFVNAPIATSCVGLALSGGGIRSAAFNLGVLQALNENGVFKCFDYLSTVSGGGYIGTSLTYWLQCDNANRFPFDKTEHKPRLEWIRRHASYLTPGTGLNRCSLAAAVTRGILINLFFLLPLWFFLVILSTFGIDRHWYDQLNASFWPAAGLMFSAMVIGWYLRYLLNSATQREAATKIESFPLRLVLWLMFILAITAIAAIIGIEHNETGASLHHYIHFGPVAVLILVRFVLPRFSKWNQVAINPALLIEGLEISAWTVVLWAFYLVSPSLLKMIQEVNYPWGFFLLLDIGVILVLKLLVNFVFFTALSATSARLNFRNHRFFDVQYGDYLFLSAGCVIIGIIPLIDHHLLANQGLFKDISGRFIASISLGGVISTVVGWWSRTKADERRGYVAILLRTGLVLLITAGVLVTYHVAVGAHMTAGNVDRMLVITWLLLVVILGAVADINYVSLHRYYRNRLMEAFLMESDSAVPISAISGSESDNLDLCKIDIGVTGAPYHLMSANLVTVGSSDEKLRLRTGDCFILSPRFIGSQATGWVRSESAVFKGMNLATAMAISGAAVDPNTGFSRSWPLRVIMSWLNVRVGYWLPNPNGQYRAEGFWGNYWYGSWYWLILQEMFGLPNETWKNVRISDGGHFENLGLYELLRRKCRLIIVSDSGCDPTYTFSDLARALERARVDFGCEFRELSTAQIQPKAPESSAAKDDEKTNKLKFSNSPFVLGEILYDPETENRGLLIYLKAALFHRLGEDVLGYARRHADFPHESTANQFFTEEQFEAYCELGRSAVFELIFEKKPQIRRYMPHYSF